MKASECNCCKCGKQAVAFWPVCDPDIPSYPYCRECLDKEKMELMIKLSEIDKNTKNDTINRQIRFSSGDREAPSYHNGRRWQFLHSKSTSRI